MRRGFSAAFVFLVFCVGGVQTTMQPGRETQSERDKKPKRRRSTAAVQTRPKQKTKAAEKHRRSPDQTKTKNQSGGEAPPQSRPDQNRDVRGSDGAGPLFRRMAENREGNGEEHDLSGCSSRARKRKPSRESPS